MGQARSRRRTVDPFNINRSFRMTAKQWRTLQMFTDEFRLLNEGNAIRSAIDNYMEPLLIKSAAERVGVATPAAATSPSPPARQPAMAPEKPKAGVSVSPDVTSGPVASDDGMMMPKINIDASDVENEDDDGPLTASSRNRARARYEEEPDRWPAD